MNSDETTSSRDLFTVATYYIPTDAHIVQGCLVAAGIYSGLLRFLAGTHNAPR